MLPAAGAAAGKGLPDSRSGQLVAPGPAPGTVAAMTPTSTLTAGSQGGHPLLSRSLEPVHAHVPMAYAELSAATAGQHVHACVCLPRTGPAQPGARLSVSIAVLSDGALTLWDGDGLGEEYVCEMLTVPKSAVTGVDASTIYDSSGEALSVAVTFVTEADAGFTTRPANMVEALVGGETTWDRDSRILSARRADDGAATVAALRMFAAETSAWLAHR